ncbi:endonuclease/exonuclease/phosphatase family protein [Enterovibrio sp. Hal110]
MSTVNTLLSAYSLFLVAFIYMSSSDSSFHTLPSDAKPNGVTSCRFATFNVAMSADNAGDMFEALKSADDPRISARFNNLAAIIQRVRPDVLLLCEFDHLGDGGDDGMLAHFLEHFLGKSQQGESPIHYPYRYLPPTNTGLAIQQGTDVSKVPQKAHGFGRHHGQYGFVVLSRYPIDADNIRCWQSMRWADMPNHRMPKNFFDKETESALRLSSKNHVVVPINVGEKTIHLIACHPTPPVFDGKERRNLRRNADELRLISDIIENAAYLVDDAGQSGGLGANDTFVVMGDLNADPTNGDGDKKVIQGLLTHPRIKPSSMQTALPENNHLPRHIPTSDGAIESLSGTRTKHKSRATHARGLRLDYVLPSNDLNVVDGGVFWPRSSSEAYDFIADESGRVVSSVSSDHQLVWLDLAINRGETR